MNSKTEKTPDGQPTRQRKLSMEEQANLVETSQQMETALRHQVAKCAQQDRLIWLLVRKLGGSTVIDEAETDPLWRMDRKRAETGQLMLTASVMDGPTEETLDKLAEMLLGTGRDLFEASRECGTDMFPPNFLAFRLAGTRVIWDNFSGKWIDSKLAKAQVEQSKQPGQN